MSAWEWSSLLFSIAVVLRFVYTLGKRINILEATATVTVVIYLVAPVAAYQVFNDRFKLSVRWETFMPIPAEVYFSYALPAVIALVVGLSFFPVREPDGDKQLLESISGHLNNKSFLGFVLVGIGLISSITVDWMPFSVRAIVYYASQLTFIGLFYLVYSPMRYRWLFVAFALALLMVQVLRTGMFGELIFWSLFFAIYRLISINSLGFWLKLGVILAGTFGIFLIQSVKADYRAVTWRNGGQGSDPGLFADLLAERLADPIGIFSMAQTYRMATRGNQGFLLARAIDYVPSHEPYAGGETIFKACAASLVPRFLWPDKPALGGFDMTCRFLGDCYRREYSYNVGQVGEAYVNFGRFGGVVFMFFYGLFNAFALWSVRRISRSQPTMLLWAPLFFFAGISLETDVLTFLNTLVKGIIFYMVIVAFFRLLLKWRI